MGHVELGCHMVSHLGEAIMEPTGMAIWPSVDHALYYDGGGHVAGVENRYQTSADQTGGDFIWQPAFAQFGMVIFVFRRAFAGPSFA